MNRDDEAVGSSEARNATNAAQLRGALDYSCVVPSMMMIQVHSLLGKVGMYSSTNIVMIFLSPLLTFTLALTLPGTG